MNNKKLDELNYKLKVNNDSVVCLAKINKILKLGNQLSKEGVLKNFENMTYLQNELKKHLIFYESDEKVKLKDIIEDMREDL